MRPRRSRLTRVRSAAAVPSMLKANQSSWNLPCTEGTPNVDPGTLRQVSRNSGLIPVLLVNAGATMKRLIRLSIVPTKLGAWTRSDRSAQRDRASSTAALVKDTSATPRRALAAGRSMNRCTIACVFPAPGHAST